MIDAGDDISVALAELLGSLIFQGQPLRFYDMLAPDDAHTPYVIIGPWLGRKANSKGRFGQTGEITLDIVTRFTGGAFSKRTANEIASLITLVVSPRPGESVLNVAGFSCYNLSVGPSQELLLNSATDTVFRKLLTLNLSLTQLN